MNGLLPDSVMSALRIGIVPVILISIYLRNRSARRRAVLAQRQAREETRAPRRRVVEVGALDAAALRAALGHCDAGDILTTAQGEPLTRWQIVAALADALTADGREAEAEAELVAAEHATDPARWPALIRLARRRAGQGREAEARALLSEVAEIRLAQIRSEARGDILLLAERLAEDQPTPPDLHDTALATYGPLRCLRLAGRAGDAVALLDPVLPAIDRALAETVNDPTGKVDGFPRSLLAELRNRLPLLAGMG